MRQCKVPRSCGSSNAISLAKTMLALQEQKLLQNCLWMEAEHMKTLGKQALVLLLALASLQPDISYPKRIKSRESWLNRLCFVSFFSFFQKNCWCQKCQNTIREAFPLPLHAFWQYLIITFQISFRTMANKLQTKCSQERQQPGITPKPEWCSCSWFLWILHTLAPSFGWWAAWVRTHLTVVFQ